MSKSEDCKSYCKPDVEIIKFDYEDVIKTSGGGPCGGQDGCDDGGPTSLFNFNF